MTDEVEEFELDPDRCKMLAFRSPDAHTPEFVFAIVNTAGETKTVVIPLSFDRLRLLVRQGQECLMRYPVVPKQPPPAA